MIVLFKIGGTSTTVTGVQIEFWNKNNNRIHLMFERRDKHVHWASISMTSEMWSAQQDQLVKCSIVAEMHNCSLVITI